MYAPILNDLKWSEHRQGHHEKQMIDPPYIPHPQYTNLIIIKHLLTDETKAK